MKHFYGLKKMPNYWVDDNDKTYSDKFFEEKEYEDFIYDNFYDLDKDFGHESSLFGTKGLPVGHPDRSSKSFDMYNERYGPMVVRVLKKKKIDESKKQLKENIEGIGERTKLEKAIARYVELSLQGEKVSKNFLGIVVDVYKTEYGQVCYITFLFKKPFTGKDSDIMHEKIKSLKPEIKTFFGIKMFDISSGNSTLESYKNQMWWYEEKKKEDN